MRRRAVAAAAVGSILLAGLPTLAVASTPQTDPAADPPASSQQFVDLGLESAIGDPIRVNNADEVLTDQGVWRNGTFAKPNQVNGNNFMAGDMSADGTVVGSESFNAAYWDSRTTLQPQDHAFSCPGVGTVSGFDAVDSADEAAGDSDCQIDGQEDNSFIAVLPSGSDDFAGQLDGPPQALQPNWETSEGSGGTGTELFNRTTGVEQQTDALTYGAMTYPPGVDELAPDGTFAGDMVSPPEDMLYQAGYQAANGAATALPEPADVNYSQANAINATDEIAGMYDTETLGDEAAVWPTPTSVPTTLSTLPQVPAGWSLDNALSINDQGDVVGTGEGPDEDEHVFLMKAGTVVSGTVNDVSCTNSSCQQQGLADQPMQLIGKDHDGNAVSLTVKTTSDGSYSFAVAAGSYQVGPEGPKHTIDGAGFDPESTPVTVTAASVRNVDFRTCEAITPPTSNARLHPAGITTAVSTSSLCKAKYSITLTARIDQSRIVDPALDASYEDPGKPGGYSRETSTLQQYLNKNFLDHFPGLGGELTYPDCLTTKQVEHFTKHKTKLRWYSYIQGPVTLGTVTVPLSWNRSRPNGPGSLPGRVTAGTPIVTSNKVKRWFVIQTPNGKLSCSDTVQAQPLVFVNFSGERFDAEVMWSFPFSAEGVQADPNTLQDASERLGEHYKWLNFYAAYENAPKLVKIAFAWWLGGKVLSLAELTSLSAVEKLATIAEYADHLKAANELGEALAGILEGGYNPMMTLVKGYFTTVKNGPLSAYPNRTVMRVAVASDKFPTYQISVTRNGKTLPWQPSDSPPIYTVNPYAKNPVGDLVDNHASLASGEHAVKEILADTGGFPAYSQAIRRTGSLATGYTDGGTGELPDPGTESHPGPGTIGWAFGDAKP